MDFINRLRITLLPQASEEEKKEDHPNTNISQEGDRSPVEREAAPDNTDDRTYSFSSSNSRASVRGGNNDDAN